jgi:peptidoglycan/LPS O-acetylase OafA/YrhL
MNDSFVSDPYAWSTSLEARPPGLTSQACSHALTLFFQTPSDLALATESSSHPAGLQALYLQPWVYAGGGLGNMEECPLQNCLAGAHQRDSLTFASVCIIPECSAYNLAASDFTATLWRSMNQTTNTLALEYTNLMEQIISINQFLGTGWTCGEFIVPWKLYPSGILYILFSTVLFLLGIGFTLKARRKKLRILNNTRVRGERPSAFDATRNVYELAELIEHKDLVQERKQQDYSSFQSYKEDSIVDKAETQEKGWLESSFDVSNHVKHLLVQHSTQTACLDGLRVGSIFWIMLGHTMAIVSSSGAGYANPKDFLPPSGYTTTVAGQLLFSSRLAVDTFLCISGFLVVHVVASKLPLQRTDKKLSVLIRYCRYLPWLFLSRVARILPLYAVTLGFHTQIAPHLGSGPFWYQWLGLLKPCHDYAWANFLFVNNFVPPDLAITETCFYHSWYLAVDLQLFLLAPILIFWYQVNAKAAEKATLVAFFITVGATAYLAYVRDWSLNTFDGSAVARFDVEAYAKPHVRAQSYLAGMYVAMILPPAALQQRSQWTLRHRFILLLTLGAMTLMTFITVTGAYARRPCRYSEWPQLNDCGSLWSPTATFLHAAFSRTVWVVAVAVLMHLCLGRDHLVAWIMSWKCWTPLSHLTYGAYLIHPIVIFIWKLGDREKQVFRLLTFCMDFLSASAVSFVFALLAALFVEYPCASLSKTLAARGSQLTASSAL